MKLCFLAAANSIHSYRWIKYFADRGHKIHWISFASLTVGNIIPNVNFYKIQQFSIKIFSILKAVFQVRKLIKEIKPEILHAHYAGIYGLIGALSGFHPFVTTTWGSDVLFAGKSKIKGPFVKFTLNKADLITCDAKHMRDVMIALGVNPKKIKIVYFGTDVKKFNPGKRSQNIRNKLRVFNSPLIVNLRNLEPIYDVKTLIKTIPLVLDEIPEAKFIIAGKGSEEEKLKKLSESLGVSENVRFVGFISNDELPEYLASADVYISTSLSDAGLSASTAEAMACGLPVIVTDSGENRIWIKDGESGFIVPVKNPEILAEKIVYLLKNDSVRAKIGKISRIIIEERNNYYKEMEKMERIYKQIIKNNE